MTAGLQAQGGQSAAGSQRGIDRYGTPATITIQCAADRLPVDQSAVDSLRAAGYGPAVSVPDELRDAQSGVAATLRVVGVIYEISAAP